MSKLQSNIQLPTVIFGALAALIIERAITLILIVPAQNYTQTLAEEYQFATEDVPWFVENFVLNGLLPQILVLAAVIVFAAVFFYFVVRDKRVKGWEKEDAAAAKASATKTVKKAPAKKTTAKKSTTKK